MFHPSSFLHPNQGRALLTLSQTLQTFAKNSGAMTKYPTWYRTLMRRAKEEEMKRFCKAQVSPRAPGILKAWVGLELSSADCLQCSVLESSGASCPKIRRPSSED